QRRGQVEIHGRRVDDEQLVAVLLDAPGGVAHEHGPVQGARLGHTGAPRLPREHREVRRIEKDDFHAGLRRFSTGFKVPGGGAWSRKLPSWEGSINFAQNGIFRTRNIVFIEIVLFTGMRQNSSGCLWAHSEFVYSSLSY